MVPRLPVNVILLVNLVFATEDEELWASHTGFLSRKENDWLQTKCGTRQYPPGPRPQSKSMGSDSAVPPDAPWALAIFNDRIKSFCSGVLISPRHVLTAGHCVQHNSFLVKKSVVQLGTESTSSLRVVLGDTCSEKYHPWCTSSTLDTRKVASVRRLWVYADYTRNDTSDIAILELGCNVRTNRNIMPICLGDNPLAIDQTLGVYGFGREGQEISDKKLHTLQVIKSRVVDCLVDTSPVTDVLLKTNEFCALSDIPERKQAPCKGDSGSGVVAGPDSNGRMNLYGIVSGGNACIFGPILPNNIYADHHTLVRPFISWIARKTGVCPNGHSCENEPRRLETDEDGEMITSGKTHLLVCGDETWTLSTKGTNALCYKAAWWTDGKINATASDEKCKTMFNAQLAPVRNEEELLTIKAAVTKSAYKPEDFTETDIIVGGFWNARSNNFKWNMDHSTALRDRGHLPLWIGDGNSVDANGNETHCMAVRLQNGSPQLTEISCEYQSQIMACAKAPVKRTTFAPAVHEPECWI